MTVSEKEAMLRAELKLELIKNDPNHWGPGQRNDDLLNYLICCGIVYKDDPQTSWDNLRGNYPEVICVELEDKYETMKPYIESYLTFPANVAITYCK